jgi:signal transduction histidine kinase/DNA-binding response OmpR family regulator
VTAANEVAHQLTPDETRLLARLSIWIEGLIVALIPYNAATNYLLFWQHGEFSWVHVVNIGSLLVCWPIVHRGRLRMIEGDLDAYVWASCAASWILATQLLIVDPRTLATAALTAVIPLTIAIVASRRVLVRAIFGTMGVLVLVAVMSLREPPREELSDQAAGIIVAVFTLIAAAVAVGLLWFSATRLKNSLSRMARANRALEESERSLERKVEERTTELAGKNQALEESQQQLALARDAALDASRTKSTFLANMSHELRTPLNAIIGYSEMLQEDAHDAGQDDLVPDLDKILTSGRYLLELINGVLDLSKIEAGKMEVFLESFEVPDLVESVATTIQPLIQKNRNSLELADSDGLGSMHSDLTKLRQVLFNLLSNASKFTEGGTIRLEAQRLSEADGDWLTFTVTDTGIGMAPEQISKIFEAFSQAEASTTREYGGTGLGLSITREFCEMLGGTIRVASEVGQGSTFTVRLPAEAPVGTESTAQDEAQVEVEPEAAPGQEAAGSRTVLMIDDDAVARDLVGRFLRREGFAVIPASSGEEGLRLARERRPDVITLDVVMPGMDGWTVLSELHADPELADIPVILLTMTDDRNLGYALGASEFLTKPVDWKRLGAALQRYAGGDSSPRALVVDDDPAARDMLRRGLERAGWCVDEAENGRVGLERVAATAPRLILLDLMMPEMDGFEFLDEFRRNAAWGSIPVLVITAKELTNEDRSRLKGGVARILQKGSLSREQLLDEVRGLVDARVGSTREA